MTTPKFPQYDILNTARKRTIKVYPTVGVKEMSPNERVELKEIIRLTKRNSKEELLNAQIEVMAELEELDAMRNAQGILPDRKDRIRHASLKIAEAEIKKAIARIERANRTREVVKENVRLRASKAEDKIKLKGLENTMKFAFQAGLKIATPPRKHPRTVESETVRNYAIENAESPVFKAALEEIKRKEQEQLESSYDFIFANPSPEMPRLKPKESHQEVKENTSTSAGEIVDSSALPVRDFIFDKEQEYLKTAPRAFVDNTPAPGEAKFVPLNDNEKVPLIFSMPKEAPTIADMAKLAEEEKKKDVENLKAIFGVPEEIKTEKEVKAFVDLKDKIRTVKPSMNVDEKITAEKLFEALRRSSAKAK